MIVRSYKILISLSTLLLSACGEDEKKKGSYQFGSPNISEIVEAAAPSGLRSASAGLNLLADCSTFDPTGSPPPGGWQLIDNYMMWLRCATFQEDTSGKVEGTAYYRYWVDVLDKAMAETEKRLASQEVAPSCMQSDPIPLEFSFRVEKPDSTESDTANVEMKINCYEKQAGAPGAESQIMAFGKDDSNFYLIFLIKHADVLTEVGKGNLIVLAKTDIEGTKADVWALSNTFLGNASGVFEFPDGIAISFNRVVADKNTGAFTYSVAESGFGQTKVASFIRSNGSQFSFTGQTSGFVNNQMQLLDIVKASDSDQKQFCYETSDLASLEPSQCAEADLYTVPSDFGLSQAPRGKSDQYFNQDLRADISSIMGTDFEAKEVGEYKSDVQ